MSSAALAQSVTIPDSGLEAAIRDQLNKPTGDLTITDLESLSSLDASSRGIRQIDGLEAARNLRILNLMDNRLVELTLDEGLSGLASLNMDDNLLTTVALPVTMQDLTQLSILRNNMESITLPEEADKLTHLSLAANHLTEVALPGNLGNLQSLSLRENQLVRLVMPKIMNSLTSLDLVGNQLTSLTLPREMHSITRLSLTLNKLTTLTLPENLDALQTLGLRDNQLEALVLPNRMDNLRTLQLSFNRLSSLALPDRMNNLTFLGLTGNQLQTLRLPTEMDNLKNLGIRDNQLSALVLPERLEYLNVLTVANNQLTSLRFPAVMDNLVTLHINGNQLTGVVLPESMRNLQQFDAQVNQLAFLVFPPEMNNLKSLSLLANQLIDLVLPMELDNLTTMALASNPSLATVVMPRELFDVPALAPSIEALEALGTEILVFTSTKDTDGDGVSDDIEAGIGEYEIVEGVFTWPEARDDAEARGGHLATITSRAELDHLKMTLGSDQGLWLGGTDEAQEGDWMWITQEPWSFTHWHPGEPNNAGGDQGYLWMGFGDEPAGLFWGDVDESSPNVTGYLLERGFVTDPSNPDTDGDGVGDGEEIRLGTSPIDPEAFPFPYLTAGDYSSSEGFAITLVVEPGTYTIEATNDLVEWTPLFTVDIQASPFEFRDVTAVDHPRRRLYRVTRQ